MSTCTPKQKRTRRPPMKVLENYTVPSQTDEYWCRILCLSNNRQYIASSTKLETLDDGLPLDERDLAEGNKVVWLPQGKKPFKAKILEVSDDKSALQRLGKDKEDKNKENKKRYREDSSSDDEEELNEPRTKKTIQIQDETIEDSDEDTIKQDTTILNPVLTMDGLFREPISLDDDDNADPNHFKESDRELLLSLKKMQDSLNAKVDKMYTMLKYLVGSRHQTPVNSTPTITPTATPTLMTQAVKQKEEDDNSDGDEDKFVLNGVNLLRIHGKDPCKYILSLMDVLFSKEDMAQSCFVKTKKSQKPILAEDKLKLIEECVTKQYGKGVYTSIADDIKVKANQKCLDQAKKMKSLVKDEEKSSEHT